METRAKIIIILCNPSTQVITTNGRKQHSNVQFKMSPFIVCQVIREVFFFSVYFNQLLGLFCSSLLQLVVGYKVRENGCVYVCENVCVYVYV